jgi:hypothetical protein
VQTIMLATGIECSYPTVEGGKRRDQLEETRHYGRCPGVSGSRPRYANLPLLEDFSMGGMRGPEA